jgi:hypothetical protein
MPSPKNYRKLPEWVTAKLKTIKSTSVVAACVRKLSKADIKAGKFAHLGISLKNDEPQYAKSVIARYDVGRTSKINAEGQEIVRKDLPMVTKSFSFDTPNYGDWSKGSHEVVRDRDVYQREHVPASENEIQIDLTGREGAGDVYVFRFAVSEVMDTKGKKFQQRLLFNMNLLLENVGGADVFASDASVADYLKTLYVNWEILPPGERESNIKRILANMPDDPEIRKKVMDRYEFLEKLKPEAFIQGHGGFKRYFGAKFSASLVVFENVEYGNAIYVMFADWEQQSKRSRQELLASGQEGKTFVRIPHVQQKWKKEVKQILAKHLGRKV